MNGGTDVADPGKASDRGLVGIGKLVYEPCQAAPSQGKGRVAHREIWSRKVCASEKQTQKEETLQILALESFAALIQSFLAVRIVLRASRFCVRSLLRFPIG